ncbi:MAG: hypothetical protein WCA49_25000 [Candidatus Sulfotelmatobacter sp.]
MPIFRLLPFSLLIAVGAATLAAQSSPEKTPVLVQSTEPGQPSPSLSTDLLSANLKTPVDAPNPLDRIRIEQYRPQLNQLGAPHAWLVDPDGQQGDNLCYSIRSFKVARDNPQSDSTHAAGYSTCQPAARFHVHTIEGGVLPVK